MSKNRYVNTGFWTDEYIEDLDPIDKYVFLYCLTNPLANIAGIYKISLSRMLFETKLEKNRLLKAFEGFKKDEKILYQDGWIACKNTIKHQKLNTNIEKGIDEIVNNSPRVIVDWVCKDYLNTDENERLYIDFQRLSKALNNLNINLNINSNVNLNSKEEKKPLSGKKKKENFNDKIKIIIDYLNLKCNKKFTYKNKSYNSHINARLTEGFTIDNFKKVIDNKLKDKNFKDNPGWYNPETLFRPSNFEKYLNEYHRKTDSEIQAEKEKEDRELERELQKKLKEDKEKFPDLDQSDFMF
jgi:uncharacterized phage protein (TIGR02220 family)